MNEHTETDVKIIENAALDDVRPSDHLTWERTMTMQDVTLTFRREGTAHHRDRDGEWRTKEDRLITDGEGAGITITIRRPVQDLPTEPGAVIVTNDGYEYIEATLNGETYYAREAVRSTEGLWLGAWRSTDRLRAYVAPDQIDPDTCKVDDQ